MLLRTVGKAVRVVWGNMPRADSDGLIAQWCRQNSSFGKRTEGDAFHEDELVS